MPKQKLFLGDFAEALAGVAKYEESVSGTNELEYRKILKILPKIIDGELSERQKKCLTMRYCENLSVTEIAEKLNIDKSTVSRHISRAKAKLKRILRYYFSSTI